MQVRPNTILENFLPTNAVGRIKMRYRIGQLEERSEPTQQTEELGLERPKKMVSHNGYERPKEYVENQSLLAQKEVCLKDYEEV